MPATIFNGDYVKALKNKLKLSEDFQLITGEIDDPSTGAGFAAPIGSVYVQGTGDLFRKDASGDTNWIKITDAAELATLQGEVDALDTRLTTAEGEIDTLQTDYTALEGRVDTVETDLTALDGDFDAHVAATAVHGVTTVAGISETQIFTNKDLSSGTNTFPDFSIAGDVTGTLSASTVTAIQGAGIAAPTVTEDGKVLAYNDTTGDFDYITVSGGTATEGAIAFGAASGAYAEDPANLFWDDTNDRLGIGNAAPTQKLDVTGSAVVSTSVGIGTTAPEQQIHIQSDGNAVGLIRQATANSSGILIVGQKSRGTNASRTVVSSGDTVAEFRGDGHTGSGFAVAGRIVLAIDGAAGVGDMPGRIEFYTTPDGSTTPVERFRLRNNGMLSIESGSISIGGAVATIGAGTTNNFAASGRSVINIGNTTATVTGFSGGVNGQLLYIIRGSTGANLTLNHQDAGSSVGNRLLIKGGVSLNVTNYGVVTLIYDGSNWQVASYTN